MLDQNRPQGVLLVLIIVFTVFHTEAQVVNELMSTAKNPLEPNPVTSLAKRGRVLCATLVTAR